MRPKAPNALALVRFQAALDRMHEVLREIAPLIRPLLIAASTPAEEPISDSSGSETQRDTVDEIRWLARDLLLFAVKSYGGKKRTVPHCIAVHIGVPKNYRERTIPLTDDAMGALSSLPRRGELVFARPDGRPLTAGMAQHAIGRACRRAGIQPIRWHALRHTFASRMAAAGTPLPSIQALLGHSSITMTMRYTHLSPSSLREAVSVFNRPQAFPTGSAWATGGQRNPFPIAGGDSLALPQAAISPLG